MKNCMTHVFCCCGGLWSNNQNQSRSIALRLIMNTKGDLSPVQMMDSGKLYEMTVSGGWEVPSSFLFREFPDLKEKKKKLFIFCSCSFLPTPDDHTGDFGKGCLRSSSIAFFFIEIQVGKGCLCQTQLLKDREWMSELGTKTFAGLL